MKRNPAVIAAEKAANIKADELAAARELVRRLEGEHLQALVAAHKAREEADADLPQCRLMRVRWRSGYKTEDAGPVVILRKTPGGTLVVRCVGAASGSTYKFKWSEPAGAYVQTEKMGSFTSDRRELRDVPEEYLPASQGNG